MAIDDNTSSMVEKDVKDIETASTQEEIVGHKVDPLSQAHMEYLVGRHGTAALDPVPTMDAADPLNFPSWKKHVNLALVSFHGMMCTLNAVGIIPAIGIWAKTYKVPIATSTYLATAQLITLALGPLLWTPFANKWGRRPVWMLSALGSALFNIGASCSQSYASHITCRIFQGFFISPGLTLAQGVVVEMFFVKQRGQKMGIWVLCVNIGTSIGPSTMGFVIQRAGWRWAYRTLAIAEFALLIGYYFFSPETLYRPKDKKSDNESKILKPLYRVLRISRVDSTPLNVTEFIKPFFLLKHINITLAIFAYAVAHNFVLTLLLVEISGFYLGRFKLSPEATGLNYLSLAVGNLLGEQLAGPLSDYFRNRHLRIHKKAPNPERRLWVSIVGMLIIIAGVTVFLVEVADAGVHWNIKPDIGAGIAAFGVQIMSTILVTYSSDSCPRQEVASLGVIINTIRLIWGFVSPFWYPYMFATCGVKASAGIVAGLMVATAIAPVVVIQLFWGRRK